MIEKVELYPDIKKIECAFGDPRVGGNKCKLYSKEDTLDTPIFWEVYPDCVNIHPFGVMNIQFSGDLGGNHSVLKVEFHHVAIVNCELKKDYNDIYSGDFLECKLEGDKISRDPDYGANWEHW